jgi:hypothetical protein
MTNNNMTLARKADLLTSDLVTDGGYLPPVSAARLMRIAIDASPLLASARIVPLRAPQQRVPKIQMAGRMLRAGSEGTPVASNDRYKPTTSQIELQTSLIRAEVDLTDEDLEDNVEGESLRNTVIELMGERASTDIEELLVSGDDTSTDDYLALFDGYLVAATTNVVDAGGDTLNKSILRDAFKAMPTEFRRNKNRLRFFTSSNAQVDYTDTIANRMTPMGDTALDSNEQPTWGSIPVVDVPLFPEDQGVGNNMTSMLLCDPNNMLVGWWRRMKVVTEAIPRAGIVAILMSMRMTTKYEHEPAVVRVENILAAA